MVHEAHLYAKHAKPKGSESLPTPKKILNIWTLWDRISGDSKKPNTDDDET